MFTVNVMLKTQQTPMQLYFKDGDAAKAAYDTIVNSEASAILATDDYGQHLVVQSDVISSVNFIDVEQTLEAQTIMALMQNKAQAGATLRAQAGSRIIPGQAFQ